MPKHRRTILREAKRNLLSIDHEEYLDAMTVLEDSMKHFYVKAIRLKAQDENDPKVDHNLKEAAALAVEIMPYRHHRLAAIKLDKDPVMGEVHENASLEELEAEMKKHWLRLAPILDLEALIAPAAGTANQEVGNGAGGAA
jgi:hypothetical protein